MVRMFGLQSSGAMSTSPCYELCVRDWRANYWLLWKLHSIDRPPILRPEYAGLVCRKCKRLDVLAALKQGISSDVLAPNIKRDIVITRDEVKLISAKARNVLESIAGVEVDYYPLPAVPDWFAAVPACLIFPPSNARTYTPVEPAVEGEAFQIRSRRCKKCGRPHEVTWRSEWYQPPEMLALAGIALERVRYLGVPWICSQSVMDVLKGSNLVGWHRLGEHRVGDSKTIQATT